MYKGILSFVVIKSVSKKKRNKVIDLIGENSEHLLKKTESNMINLSSNCKFMQQITKYIIYIIYSMMKCLYL
jgi:hypothetical protein